MPGPDGTTAPVDPGEVGAMFDRLTAAHGKRMAQLGLSA
jgi:hypothetical protein